MFHCKLEQFILGKYNLEESDLQISSIVTRKVRTLEMLSLFSNNEINYLTLMSCLEGFWYAILKLMEPTMNSTCFHFGIEVFETKSCDRIDIGFLKFSPSRLSELLIPIPDIKHLHRYLINQYHPNDYLLWGGL